MDIKSYAMALNKLATGGIGVQNDLYNIHFLQKSSMKINYDGFTGTKFASYIPLVGNGVFVGVSCVKSKPCLLKTSMPRYLGKNMKEYIINSYTLKDLLLSGSSCLKGLLFDQPRTLSSLKLVITSISNSTNINLHLSTSDVDYSILFNDEVVCTNTDIAVLFMELMLFMDMLYNLPRMAFNNTKAVRPTQDRGGAGITLKAAKYDTAITTHPMYQKTALLVNTFKYSGGYAIW